MSEKAAKKLARLGKKHMRQDFHSFVDYANKKKWRVRWKIAMGVMFGRLEIKHFFE